MVQKGASIKTHWTAGSFTELPTYFRTVGHSRAANRCFCFTKTLISPTKKKKSLLLAEAGEGLKG